MASFTSQMKNKQTKKQTPAARELKNALLVDLVDTVD